MATDKATLAKKKQAFALAARKICSENYLKYVEIVNDSGNKDADWIPGKHLVFLCNKVQEFIETETGNAYDILVLNLPPQHGKSVSITETLPSWFLGKYPDFGVIALAYGDDLAQRFGRRNKEKVERWGKIIFGITISKSKSANDDFEIEGRKGRMITRGVMAGVTGNPAKLLLIDDPVRTKEEAFSPVTREKLWQEWQSSMKTRLANGAKVILIMTRWFDDDLAGQILKTEKNVTHINLTCEAEEDDILGREVGDGLFPEIGKGRAWKDEMKASYIASDGMDAWLSMYQGKPVMQSGNIFKRDWFKYYDRSSLPTMYQTIISVDAAFKDTKTSDFVAIGVWGKSGSSVYLLDRVNERMDFVRTVETIRYLKQKHPQANMVLVEDKANGSAIISTLRREIMGVVPVEPLGSKESRAFAIQPFVMAGNVHLPKGEAWVEEYLDQMARFPKAKHDDEVDQTSQALIRLKDYSASAPAQEPKKSHFALLSKPKTALQQMTGGKPSNSYMKY